MIGIRIDISMNQRARRARGGAWWEYLTGGAGAWEAALADDKASSLVNLLNSGIYMLSEINGSITWTSGLGWSGFASGSCFLYTGITVPGGLMIQFSDITNPAPRCTIGCTAPLAGNTSYSIFPAWYSPTTNRAYETAGGNSSIAGQQSTATMALSAGQPYLNGVPDGSAIDFGSPATSPIGIGAGIRRTDVQGGWALEGFCDGYIERAIVWTTPPSSDEVLAIHEMWIEL